MELYTWEYEGKEEYGICVNRYCATGKREFRWLNGAITRWEDSITNLRPAKVVDADAVVVEGLGKLEILERALSLRDLAQSKARLLSVESDLKLLDAIIKQVQLTPPVTEEVSVAKTYMTTEQFIEVWKSLDGRKRKKLSAAWDAAWYAVCDAAWDTAWYDARFTSRYTPWYTAWDAAWGAVRDDAWEAAWNAAREADLAVFARDEITAEQFEILTQPWTSCGLSLFAEDWDFTNGNRGDSK